MSTVAIAVEGVLRRPIGGQPIRPGLDLYFGLATRTKIILLTDEIYSSSVLDLGTWQGSELEHWLMIEGMSEHVKIFYNDPAYDAGYRLLQVNKARAEGHDVTLVVEADPATSAGLLQAGYNVLTFTHAEYAVPIWRPDYKHSPSPWDQLVSRVEHEALLRAKDTRRDNEQGSF